MQRRVDSGEEVGSSDCTRSSKKICNGCRGHQQGRGRSALVPEEDEDEEEEGGEEDDDEARSLMLTSCAGSE
jgi:hypothetical protein